ncbi:MAG TPA: hypothetical protein VMU54_23490, partial [Planctomycetota bacterium]|nr:hypothetical protein [Planctomycetota bacterium]
WEGRLDALIAAWDKAATEAPTPGRLLYRAKLEELAAHPKPCRERLEEAVRKFPGEPSLLWHLARARFEAGDRGPAARSLEEMASVQGAAFDLDEFHRLLVICYAETGRRAAAVEHLRALRKEDENAVEFARLASKARLPEEAARLYRIALQEEPERISLRLGLVVALVSSGERGEAAAERSRLFLVDGKFSTSKLEDYFLLLPAEGRSEEIVRTLHDLREPPVTSVLGTIPNESRTSVMAEWERTIRDGRDWALLGRMKSSWVTEQARIDVLARGETRFPKDPWIVREKIDALDKLEQFKEVGEAYARLCDLDREGRITGPRPMEPLTRALRDLSLKDVPAAIRMALQMLGEPGLDDASAAATRGALRPGWELSGGLFWEELRKTKLPRPAKAIEESVRAQMEKLSADDFEERAAAAAQLKKGGLPSIPVLLERIDDKDAEVRSRVRAAIRAILTD